MDEREGSGLERDVHGETDVDQQVAAAARDERRGGGGEDDGDLYARTKS